MKMRAHHASIPALSALGLGLFLSAAPAAADGKEVFLGQKCNTCHAVSTAAIEATTKSEKMKGPDLKGSVAERGLEWTTKYLRKEIDHEGKKHAKDISKLSEADVQALLTWLEQQK